MSEMTMRLRKLQEDCNKLVIKNQPPMFVWQAVTAEHDLVQDAMDFAPVDIHRRPVTLPDDQAELIRLLNLGEVLLLSGILRLFVVPASMDPDQVGKLIEALRRRFGGNHSAVYKAAYKLLFPKEKTDGKCNR